MSYLIHNFYKPTVTNRSTLRIRTSFIARNYPILFTLLSSHSKAFNLTALTYGKTRDILRVGRENFCALSRVLFSKSYTLKYTPLGINFPQAAYHWTLNNMVQLASPSQMTKPKQFPTLTSTCFTYPYFQYNKIVITPVTKKPFLLTLNKLLRMSLLVWFQWPNVYKIESNFTNITGSYWFLRFLNKYYFKVYNI